MMEKRGASCTLKINKLIKIAPLPPCAALLFANPMDP